MTAVRDSSGTALASYRFDDRSRRTALTYANGASAAYSYDTASRLLSLDNQAGSGPSGRGKGDILVFRLIRLVCTSMPAGSGSPTPRLTTLCPQQCPLFLPAPRRYPRSDKRNLRRDKYLDNMQQQ